MTLPQRKSCTGALSALGTHGTAVTGWRCDCGTVFVDPMLAADHCRVGGAADRSAVQVATSSGADEPRDLTGKD